MVEFLILTTIFLPWLGALAVFAANRLMTAPKRENSLHALAVGFSTLAGAAALALLFFNGPESLLHFALNQGPADSSGQITLGAAWGEVLFVADGLGVFLAVIANVIGSLAVLFSVDYLRGEKQLGRYYALVLLFIGAMSGLVLSGSLLYLFFFWEITALCSYALISFYNDDPKAVAGGLKALIITQLGGVGLLAGALVIYTYLGTYEISIFLAQPGLLPAGALGLAGFCFLAAAAAKSAQVPFHTWLPDAMEAPSPISALIHAATMVNAGVYLLARFYPAFAEVPGWRLSVTVVGMLTALLAALLAIRASDLKRVLAYSTVSQLGYMVFAIGAGGVFASAFHLFSHAIFKALLFLAAGAVIHSVGTRELLRMGGLGKAMPFTRLAFVIGALALAGIPPLNGFWSKELALEAGLEGAPLWANAVMMLGAGLTALYTLRMVWLVFFGAARNWPQAHPHDAGPAMKVSLGLLSLAALVSWLWAGPFGAMLEHSLPHHHLHVLGTAELAQLLLTAPPTWLALGLIALGAAGWYFWLRPLEINTASKPDTGALGWLQATNFGFDWLNQQTSNWTQSAAAVLQRTQTGALSWNLFGFVAGLAFILVLLVMGG